MSPFLMAPKAEDMGSILKLGRMTDLLRLKRSITGLLPVISWTWIFLLPPRLLSSVYCPLLLEVPELLQTPSCKETLKFPVTQVGGAGMELHS